MAISPKLKEKIFDNYCKNQNPCKDFAGRKIIKVDKKSPTVSEKNSSEHPGLWDIDHIIPQNVFENINKSQISFIKTLDSEKNLQPVHRKTNEEKGNELSFVANKKQWKVIISPHTPNSTKRKKLEIVPSNQKLSDKQIEVQSLVKASKTKKQNQTTNNTNNKNLKNEKVENKNSTSSTSTALVKIKQENQSSLKPILTTKELLNSYKNQFHIFSMIIEKEFNFNHLNLIEEAFLKNNLQIKYYFCDQKFSGTELKYLNILVKHSFSLNTNFNNIFLNIIDALSSLEQDKEKFLLKKFPIFWNIQSININDLRNFKSNIFTLFFRSQESLLANRQTFKNTHLLVAKEIKNSLSLIYNLDVNQWNTDKNTKWFWLKQPY